MGTTKTKKKCPGSSSTRGSHTHRRGCQRCYQREHSALSGTTSRHVPHDALNGDSTRAALPYATAAVFRFGNLSPISINRVDSGTRAASSARVSETSTVETPNSRFVPGTSLALGWFVCSVRTSYRPNAWHAEYSPSLMTRRTPEQIVADLEQKIADVKGRAIAKEAKQNPEAKPFVAAVKAIDKAMEAATNEETTRALEAARAPLSTRLVEMGLRLADRKTSSVRRKKGDAA